MRTFDSVIESCYWYISADTKKWDSDSEILIYLDASSTASMYVYAGNDRRNATLIVETNSSVPIGAPARVPISSGAIVVLQINSGSTSGNATFSYRVSGVKYNWYEAPFIGKAYWVYILFLIALALGFAIVICCPVLSITCCACLCSAYKKR